MTQHRREVRLPDPDAVVDVQFGRPGPWGTPVESRLWRGSDLAGSTSAEIYFDYSEDEIVAMELRRLLPEEEALPALAGSAA